MNGGLASSQISGGLREKTVNKKDGFFATLERIPVFSELCGGVGNILLQTVHHAGGMSLLFWQALESLFRPPVRIRLYFLQMEFIGVNSFFVVVLTGLFTGMVIAIQTYYAFRMFSAESMVGATVALSMARELGPVVTALMVTGRAGSAMAAEIGSMRVSEQIDALTVMAIDPVQYLILPRLVAATLMMPLLAVFSSLIGVAGGYLVGVKLLGVQSGIFMNKIYEMVTLHDVHSGLIKAAVFGLIMALVGCYYGFITSGGAKGVGRSTTHSVVVASVLILMSDYIMTALMF